MTHEEVFERWAEQLRVESMVIRECPHCGRENWVIEADEEPTCEVCDGYLDDVVNEEE